MSEKNLSPIEKIKQSSHGLRGTIVDSLHDEITGAIREDDQAVIKFHGMYQQDDRDLREERASQKLDRLYSFMIRLRLPGGALRPEQWKAVHEIAGENSSGVIKITTRQTVQLHGLIKSKIKPTIQSFRQAELDSIATCGDINRNVLCSSFPGESKVHEEVFAYAGKISELLMPKTRAYYEIWLDEEKIVDKKDEDDPLYQDRYLPRKFKIAIAIPPDNDVDVFTNDIGLIAIVEKGKLLGFNLVVGGGLSTTHGSKETYPRLGTVLGFCTEEQTLKAVYEVLTVQRDFGNRSDRKQARLKYTLDRLGVEGFKAELENRIGFKIAPARGYEFARRSDYFGWHKSEKGLWYYTLFVENGRVADDDKVKMKSALLEVAESGLANFRFTCNQNLMLADVREKDKATIQTILSKYRIIQLTDGASNMRKNSMACVALNTCPLALAEGQRYLPTLISRIEPLLRRNGLEHEEITIRMTGCPNGCARPYVAEIGLVGTAPGLYNLHLGGDKLGLRLNKKYRENLDETTILSELEAWLGRFKSEKKPGETFGDFAFREVRFMP